MRIFNNIMNYILLLFTTITIYVNYVNVIKQHRSNIYALLLHSNFSLTATIICNLLNYRSKEAIGWL